jgi:hypothetical protein
MSDTRNVVLVCGGRDYKDYAEVSRILHDLHIERPITMLIHGAAAGADSLADIWARANNIPIKSRRANWVRDGNSAGPIRNGLMLRLDKPHLVVAFPGGKGTAHMVGIAKKAGVRVIEISPSHPSETPSVEDPKKPEISGRKET